MNCLEIAKEYFPDYGRGKLAYILWEYTGYPAFWNMPEDGETPEECLRKQLLAASRTLSS